MNGQDIGDLQERKAELRRAAFAARKAAFLAGGAAAGEAAATVFLGGVAVPEGAVVSGYLPIRTEIDPLPLMTALTARGHRVVVPVIEGNGLPLRFREWRPGVAMVPGPFGTELPAEGDWLDPEVLVAPLVAFDAGCWRLGYGGGFYDRTIARLSAQRPTLAVGLAFAGQEVAEIPRDATDRRLDAVATEAGLRRPEGA